MAKEPVLQLPDSISRLESLEEIHHRYALRGIRYAFSMVRNRCDAEEITQESFCRLIAANPCWKDEALDDLQAQFAPLFFTTRSICARQM